MADLITGNYSNYSLYETFVLDNFTYPNLTLVDYVADQVASSLNIYYTPMLVLLGLLGNGMCVSVFFTSKLRLQSTSQYLSALAISDSVFLVQLLPPWLNALGITGVFHEPGFCQVFVYTSYVTSCLSAWLVVAFTVERFVAVLYPLRRNAVCTVARARHVIASIVLASLLINLPVLRFATPTTNDCNIDYNYLEHAARFNIIDTGVSFTLPLLVIVVLNSWIMAGVWRLERARTQLVKAERPAGRRVARVVGCPRSQNRITRMLLIVSSVFVVLNLPAYTMRILAYALHMTTNDYSGRWSALQQVAILFFNSNFGINFVLYCLSGQNFRRALLQTFPCLRPRARRAVALRRPTAYHPARASSVVSTSFVSCTEATTNCAVVSVGPSRRERFISRWTFDNSRHRQPGLGPAPPTSERIELQNFPTN
ncbi:thyrotropin-releasing hormone receptor-like [Ostrinia furnacalis]|uniref:thyrotropin-releasing hormone receptor-like n=1 Tax=Ostrinia furnacalis TaxID=93504 RepID=UPI00104095B1|nr:thyrotropin-releasing hormone receptor-like [Ostrinia furnacalis]